MGGVLDENKKTRAVVDLDIVLTATGRLSGQVTLEGLTTNLYGSFVYAEGTSYIAATDGAGNFELKDIPVGTYNLVFYHEGYLSFLKTAVIINAAVDNPVGAVNLIKKSNNTYLSGITFSNGTLDPVFNKYTTLYDLNLATTVSSITLTPTVEDTNSTIKVNGIDVVSGLASQAISLSTGKNIITIDVISQTGNFRSYNIVYGEDCVSIVWKGNLAVAPLSPQLNWAYYNTVDKKSYIYNGSSWSVMAESGLDGLSGTDGTDGQDNTAYMFVVFFNSNGATTPASFSIKVVRSPASTVGTLPSPPQKTNYTFAGWFTGINGIGTELKEDTTVTADMELYAKWTLNYSITYNLNEGVNHPSNPDLYTVETSVITLSLLKLFITSLALAYPPMAVELTEGEVCAAWALGASTVVPPPLLLVDDLKASMAKLLNEDTLKTKVEVVKLINSQLIPRQSLPAAMIASSPEVKLSNLKIPVKVSRSLYLNVIFAEEFILPTVNAEVFNAAIFSFTFRYKFLPIPNP